MNINHLRYFEEVCKQGSITRASEHCHVSQPSVTAAINGLEKEIGCKLFARVNNRLRLTSEGEAFRRLTADFLAQFHDYYEKACDLCAERTAKLKVGVPPIMGTFFFKKIIPDFQNRFPQIQLEFYEIATINGLRMLHNAELDFLLGIQNSSTYTNCDSRLIFNTELQLAVHKDHPLCRYDQITEEHLSGLPLVIMSKGSYHYEAVTCAFSETDLNFIMYSSQLSTIKYMLESGSAASILYKEIFANDLQIRYIPFANPLLAQIHIFWQKNTYLSSAMHTFISYITSLKI